MSKLIKNNHYISADSYRMLSQTQAHALAAEVVSSQNEAISEELEQQRERLLQQEQELEERQNQLLQMQQALLQDADEAKLTAQQEIEQWWKERRAEDEKFRKETLDKAEKQGLKEGNAKGIKEAEASYASKIQAANELLLEANRMKMEIIAEAEPFLVDLSISIAQKIIQKQLSIQPHLMINFVKDQLRRKTLSGTITLAVFPEQFSIVNAGRDQLKAYIDPQSELVIVADAQLKPFGCSIRTKSGVMDCSVDTQLETIREALQQIALGGEEGVR